MKSERIICNLLASLITVTAMAQQSSKTISCIEIYDLETRSHSVLKEFPFLIEAPNWTPDGKYLVVNKGGKLYKISVDGTGHVNGATAVSKEDIIDLGIIDIDLDTKENMLHQMVKMVRLLAAQEKVQKTL